jgi:hypothetical protein
VIVWEDVFELPDQILPDWDEFLFVNQSSYFGCGSECCQEQRASFFTNLKVAGMLIVGYRRTHQTYKGYDLGRPPSAHHW